MPRDGRAGSSKQGKARRKKTVLIDDRRAHDEAHRLVVELLKATTWSQGDEEIQATADTILKAGGTRTALNAARNGVTKGPSRRAEARVLESLDLARVEAEVNRILWQDTQPRIPPGAVSIAIDLNKIPYHGKPYEAEDELYRSKALSGTTYFHCYATLYVVARNKRYTVALRFVRKGTSSTQALESLLLEAQERGLRVRIVYADKAFATVEATRLLRERVPAFVIPLPLKGKKAKNLQQGRSSHWTTYTLGGPKTDHHVTMRVAVVVKRNTGKYHGKKKGNVYFPYLTHGLQGKTPRRVDRLYRNRGGIESSYKLANRCRPRTSSQNPAIRLFNYAVALFLQNAWVTVRWLVALPRRGRSGREAPNGFFPFTQYLELVLIRLRDVLGERRRVAQLGAHG